MTVIKNSSKPVPSTVSDIFREETELAEMERQLKQRQKLLAVAKRELDTSTPTHHLAIAMHERLCRWNHTDGCGWHYEIKNGIHNWDSSSHRFWLQKAHLVMRRVEMDPVTPSNIVEFFEKLVD